MGKQCVLATNFIENTILWNTSKSVGTAVAWLRRRAGLHEKGGFDFANLGDEAFLEVEEDYQVCMRRSG